MFCSGNNLKKRIGSGIYFFYIILFTINMSLTCNTRNYSHHCSVEFYNFIKIGLDNLKHTYFRTTFLFISRKIWNTSQHSPFDRLRYVRMSIVIFDLYFYFSCYSGYYFFLCTTEDKQSTCECNRYFEIVLLRKIELSWS